MKDTHKRFFKLAFCGILIALMFTFSWTILGMVPLGVASATTVFIPVAIGIVCLDDFRYTSVLGLSCGIICLIRATVPNGFLDPFFLNPLVSVLPRFLMAIITHLCYRLLCKVFKHSQIKSLISGGLTALFNTIFTISSLLIVYYNDVTVLLKEANTSTKAFLGAIALTNMLPEIVLGAIVTYAVSLIYIKNGFIKSEKNKISQDEEITENE